MGPFATLSTQNAVCVGGSPPRVVAAKFEAASPTARKKMQVKKKEVMRARRSEKLFFACF